MLSCSRHHLASLELESLRAINHDLHHLLNELNTYISICKKEMHAGERLSLAGQLKNAAEDFIQATGDPKIFKSERFGITLSEAPQKILGRIRPDQFYLNMGQTITRIVNNIREALRLNLIQPFTPAFALQEKLHFAIDNFLRMQREIRVEFPRQMQTLPAPAPSPVVAFTPTFSAPPQHIFPYQQAVPPPQLVAPQPFQNVQVPVAPPPLPYGPPTPVIQRHGPRTSADSRMRGPEFEKIFRHFMEQPKI